MKVAKLFKNGGSQAVRIPKAYAFEGERVVIARVGNGILIQSLSEGLEDWFASLDFSDDFMADGRRQPNPQERAFSL